MTLCKRARYLPIRSHLGSPRSASSPRARDRAQRWSAAHVVLGALLATPLAAQDAIGVTWAGTVQRIEVATGASTQIFEAEDIARFNSMAEDSKGNLFTCGPLELPASALQGLFAIDVDAGTVQLVTSLAPVIDDVRAMAFDGNDQLYVVVDRGFVSDRLYRVDLPAGTATLIGETGVTRIQSLSIREGVFFAWNAAEGLGTLDPASGVYQHVNPNAPPSLFLDIQTLAIDSLGRLVGGREELYFLDAATGATQQFATTGLDMRGLEFLGCSDFRLAPPSPGVAGQANVFQVYCATPENAVAIVASTTPGLTSLGGICPGLVVDMNQPRLLGFELSSSVGQSQARLNVPAEFFGVEVLLQAVDLRSCSVSELVTFTFS